MAQVTFAKGKVAKLALDGTTAEVLLFFLPKEQIVPELQLGSRYRFEYILQQTQKDDETKLAYTYTIGVSGHILEEAVQQEADLSEI